jgi:UDP-2,3-diacylglucosamine hydrolase
MDEFTSLIVSDAHLGAAPQASERAFREFLVFAGGRTRDLLINGDLFDFWFEYDTVILRRHFSTLRILADLVDAGVRVRLVGGNHDFWGGTFLSQDIGIEVLDGPVRTEVGGRQAYIAHGDGLGGGDLGYRALRTVIRSRPARVAYRLIHPDWSDWLVRLASRTESSQGREGDEKSLDRASKLTAHAEQLLAASPEIQLVVFGHCHIPELREVSPGRHYLNTGDWIHHCTWAEVNGEGVRLNRWNRR